LQKKLKASDREIVWAMIRAALVSKANTAIVPAQDLQELGSEARMNLPGIPKGNWGWRLQKDALTEKLAQRLRSLTMKYGRQLDDKLVSAAGFPEEDLTPQIAKRAYELYEQRGCKSGQPNQDWLHAERELKDEESRFK
jgi:4-alpha-glucanotransferase